MVVKRVQDALVLLQSLNLIKSQNDLHGGITAEALETPNRGLSALTWKPNTVFLKGLWLAE